MWRGEGACLYQFRHHPSPIGKAQTFNISQLHIQELLFKEFLEEVLVWIRFTIGQQGVQLFLLDEFPKLFIVFYRFMERFFNPEKLNPSNPFQILDKLITYKAIVPID